MSDHWEQFPCSMGERIAFISYDHGVRSDLERLPFPYFASFKVDLLTPDDRGFPQGEEFAKLNEVEDFLCSQFGQREGIQVGRVTTNGRRYFHFYTSLSKEACDSIAQQAGKLHSHQVALLHEPDADRSHYWNELFPTDDDWQVIQDIRLQDALQRKGDLLQKPRAIEHWAYFNADTDRSAFVATVRKGFDRIELFESPDRERNKFAAKLTHISLPDYRSMNATTLLLGRAARAHGGDYDGWEAQVCRE